MTVVLVRAAGLLLIYLLVLTSLDPGDILVGGALALALSLLIHRFGPRDHPPTAGGVRALGRTLLATFVGMVVGTVRTIRACLGPSDHGALVEIPIDGRSRREIALWGVLTGESPDEYPVDVDDARGVMLVHVLDARDPEGVRERHRRAREQWLRDVVD